jgi:hypothetical protein
MKPEIPRWSVLRWFVLPSLLAARVLFEDGRPYGEQVYVSFLGKDQKFYGRPVDVIVAGDGSLLISDDYGNRIYRLRYMGKS